MIQKLSRHVSNHPWPYVISFIVFALAFASRLPSARVDPEVKNQLPPDFPARAQLDHIEEMFGGTELMMITLVADDVLEPETLRRIKALSDRMVKLRQVDRVLSLFELKDIRAEGDKMVVQPAVEQIPTSKAAREALRADLRDNDLIYGSVVSRDFRATAIVGLLSISAPDDAVVKAVDKIVAETPGPGKVQIAGMPLVRDFMSRSIRGDLQRFMPLGLVIMLVFLFLSFRQLRGVLLPFFVVVMSVQVAMGLIPVLGWKIQMITNILPVILLAVANDYGIHIIARYQEVNTPGNTLTRGELARNVLQELAKPIVIAGLTTMAGLLCLGMHIIVPAKQLGILATLGIAFAVLASLVWIPALLALLPKARPLVTAAHAGGGKLGLMDRMLVVLARVVSSRPRTILVIFVAVVAVVAFGITRIEVDTNTINYFPEDHPIPRGARVADRYFGGSTTFSVTISGDIKHPRVLRRLDRLEKRLRQDPLVDESSSIARVIRRMNKVMNRNDPRFDRIPDTREAVAQLLLMYENSGEPDDFDRLVDFDYKNALLTVRVNTQSTYRQSRLIGFVRRYLEQANLQVKVTAVTPAGPPATRPAPGPASAPASQPGGQEDSPFTLVQADGEGEGKQEADEGSPFTLTEGEGEGEGGASQPAASRPAAAPIREVGGKFIKLGGFAVLFTDLLDALIYGQLSSLGVSLLAVVLIVAILFRSVVAGLLTGCTLGLAMAFLFGLMGLLGVPLSLPTAMMSSIMIGVGVDYTIHFLWRYRQERRDGLEHRAAVVRTLTTTGRGIIINALSVVVGFSVMLISLFVPVRYFGFLVVVSISACLLGAMVLMPALALLLKPRFLENGSK
jgi:predicted RND superfamily exporter protein